MSRRQRQLESAARVREARKRRRLVQFAKVPEDTRFSKEEIAALHSIFSRGPSSAERERARALHVERKWLARAVRVAADSCISMEIEGLMVLLRDVERSRDQKLQPGNFVLCRMYDESPFTVRTKTLSEGGHLEGEASTAKVMGAQLRFAFTCLTSNSGSEQPPRAHIIRGLCPRG